MTNRRGAGKGEVDHSIVIPTRNHPTMAWGGILTIRKHVFKKVVGSHPYCPPSRREAFQGHGEMGLTVKLGVADYRARSSPDCVVLHSVPAERMSLEYLGRRPWFVSLQTSFTQARRENGMSAGDGVFDMPAAQRRPLGRLAAGSVCRQVRARMARALLPSTSVSVAEKMAGDVRQRLAAAQREGYLWHRERLASMPHLREYVCRPDFLGANALLPAQPRSVGGGQAHG